jgi:hypothetical protein
MSDQSPTPKAKAVAEPVEALADTLPEQPDRVILTHDAKSNYESRVNIIPDGPGTVADQLDA